ncbi:hypothetical protein AC249_AIPGENE11283 [Exaiptasia diaphana]|nr:hypothetical protein AC249_AIPGENE11283 [Exaiptasia diaphana]
MHEGRLVVIVPHPIHEGGMFACKHPSEDKRIRVVPKEERILTKGNKHLSIYGGHCSTIARRGRGGYNRKQPIGRQPLAQGKLALLNLKS